MRALLFFPFLLFACSNKAAAPKDILPTKKMEAVLYDVIRADELVDFLRLGDSTYQKFSRRTELYDSVFQLHSVKKEVFQKSLRFYQGRPDLLKEILDDLQKKVTDTVQKKAVM